MRTLFSIALLLGCCAVFPVQLATATSFPTRAPSSTELRDQYNRPQRLDFPSTNVVVLTIADRKGSEQIQEWVAALHSRYAGRIDLRGIADVGSVPEWLRGRVRKKFQETLTYPVMLDWSGKTCPQFGFKPDVANILIIDRDGSIQARLSGSAQRSSIAEACSAINISLTKSMVPK
jgi:hypothetical protein